MLGEECARRGLREGFVIVCRARGGAGRGGVGSSLLGSGGAWVYLKLTRGWVEKGVARAAVEDSQAIGPR